MITFAEWVKVRDLQEYGVANGLPYGGATTMPTSVQTQPQVTTTASTLNSIGTVPPAMVQQLQKTGPMMQDVVNTANNGIKLGKYRDLTSALGDALKRYKPSPGQTTTTTAMPAITNAPGQTTQIGLK